MNPTPSAPAPKRSPNPLILVLGLSAAFFVLFLVISAALFMTRSPGRSGGPVGGALFGKGSVAVVEVNGIILDSKKTLRRLERLEEDNDVKAVVLRLNSPGGSVGPSQEIYEAIRRYKKPVVASMGSVAASGAFYIACGAKKVFANPGTLTGSIGVIMEFANLEKLYEWAKIHRYAIKTGKFKGTGAEYREMTVEERELLQRLVDEVLVHFKKAVAEGRGLTLAQVNEVADGRVLTGSQAKARKLVDELGTIQDAIDEAAGLAGIKGKPNVVYPERRKRRLLELLLDDNPGEDSDSSSEEPGWAEAWVSRLLGRSAGDAVGRMILEPGVYWLWPGAR